MSDDAFWAAARRRAAELDAADPLADQTRQFYLPDDLIYLDGNSLGPAPRAAFRELDDALKKEWAEDLITSWNKADWFVLCERYGDLLAPVIGADAGEVVVCDTTSLNIYKTVHAGLSLRPGRRVIVAEGGGFPTDLYVLEGVLKTRPDLTLRLEGVDGERLEDLIDDDVAVVLVNQVDYRSGRLRDIKTLTEGIHAAGAIAVWDLCHSAGAVEVGLNDAGVDLAIGCTYKYLNGGPGAPAFVFAARRHLAALSQPLSGWWGHAAPFAFERGYRADAGIRQFLCGTQPILSLRAAKAGLQIAAAVPIESVRAKSVSLTELFIDLVERSCAGFGVELISPRRPAERGSQVSLGFKHAYPAVQALIGRGVVGDFRAPDVMRFGFTPLYLSHAQTCEAAARLADVLRREDYLEPQYQRRAAVT